MELSEIESLFSQGRYLEVRLCTEPSTPLENHQREKQLYALSLSKSGAAEADEKFFRKYTIRHLTTVRTRGSWAEILTGCFAMRAINAMPLKP